MNLEILKKLDGNHFHIIASSLDQMEDLRYTSLEDNGEHAVRFVRGDATLSIHDFHHEIAVAFQFPYYYGHNSSAFLDVMKDLSWLKRERYTMVVLNAENLLNEEDDLSKKRLLEDLWEVGQYWGEEVEEQYRKPFKIIFQAEKEEIGKVQALLEILNTK